MALAFDDIREVLTGGGASATTSPVAAMRATTKATSDLLVEETKSNKQMIKLTKEILDAVKGVGHAGSGGLDLGDLMMFDFIKKAYSRLRSGTGKLAKKLGGTVVKYAGHLTTFATTAAEIVFGGIGSRIKAAGSPLMRNLKGIAATSARTVVSLAGKAVDGIGHISSRIMAGVSGIAKLGGNMKQMGKYLPKLSTVAKIGGGLLKKVALPVQAVFSLFDAVEGWNNADQILGKPATLKGKIISAMGSVLNGLTFGLSDTIVQWFGGNNLASMLNDGLDKFGAKVYSIFDNLWQSVPDWETVKASLPDLSTLVNTFVTTPARYFKQAVDYVLENFPDVSTLAANLGNAIWDGMVSLFDGIKGKVTGAFDDVYNYFMGEDNPKPAMDADTKKKLDNVAKDVSQAFVVPKSIPFDKPLADIPTELEPVVVQSSTVSSVTPWAFTQEGSKYWIDELSEGIAKALSKAVITPAAAATNKEDTFIGKDTRKYLIDPVTGQPKNASDNTAITSSNSTISAAGDASKRAASELTASREGYMSMDDLLKTGGDYGSDAAVSGGSIDTGNIETPTLSSGKSDGQRATGSSSRARLMNILTAGGVNRRVAAAITGNVEHESAGFQTTAVGDRGVKGGTAFGLMQWRGGRKANLFKFAKEKGLDPKDLDTQGKFILEEINRNSKYHDPLTAATYERMSANPNVSLKSLSDQFMWGAERPSRSAGAKSSNRRARNAQAALNLPLEAGDATVSGGALPVGTVSGEDRLTIVGNAKARGPGDERLTDIAREASRYLPEGYRVEMFSGRRPGDEGSRHADGNAQDFRIIDPKGKVLDNFQSKDTFRMYERFAQYAKKVQTEKYPKLNLRWGGYFAGKGGPRSRRNGNDAMHLDIGGGNMLAGSWENGLNPEYRGVFDSAANPSVGMGDVGKFQLPKIGSRMTAYDSLAKMKDMKDAISLSRAATARNAALGINGVTTAGLKVGAGIDTFQSKVPAYTDSPMLAQPQPLANPTVSEKKIPEREDVDINKLRTMDEMNVLYWNNSSNG